jgi:hypothetical protein
MARAGPIVRGPARFGSYRKPLLVFPYLPPEQHGALRPQQLWRLSQVILRVPHHFSDAVKSGSGPPQREGGRWQVGIGVLRLDTPQGCWRSWDRTNRSWHRAIIDVMVRRTDGGCELRYLPQATGGRSCCSPLSKFQFLREGGSHKMRRTTVVSSTGELYRQLARDFHLMARSLPPGENRSPFLNAAEEWDRLADQQEHATDLNKE